MKTPLPEIANQEFDITPMIDVVFLLITFFMVVSGVITEKQYVALPVADHSKTPESIEGRMEFSISQSGQLYMGRSPLTDQALAELIAPHRDNPSFRVLLRADARADHRHVQHFMKVCADNGVSQIIFSTLQH